MAFSAYPKSVANDLIRTPGKTVVSNKKCPPPPAADANLVRSTFWRYDTDRDGRLNKHELEEAFDSLGSHFPWLRAILALHHADRNHDGYISQDEFERLLSYALNLGYKIRTTS